MEKIPNFIGGQAAEPASGRYMNNVEPATGKVYSYVACSEADDVDAAVEAVRPDQRAEPSDDDEPDHEHGQACDVLYQALRTGEPPDRAGRHVMAQAYAAIVPQVTAHEDSLAQFRAARTAAAPQETSP